jgi:glutathione peroxidase
MSFSRIGLRVTVLGFALASAAVFCRPAQARPAFAKKEGVGCTYCHVVPGGPRGFRGMYYGSHGHSFAAFDNVYEAKAAGVKPDAMAGDAVPTVAGYPNVMEPAVLDFVLKDIDGKTVNLGRYEGDVILMVNVASKCGNTPQYASLEKLYSQYKDKGFVILGFPANDFGHQEPGDEKQIKEFCSSTYHVEFPMFSKIVVKGDGQAPLYKFLTGKDTDPTYAGDIEWNFAKFLINRKGEIIGRFKAGDDPLKKTEIADAIAKEVDTPQQSASAN